MDETTAAEPTADSKKIRWLIVLIVFAVLVICGCGAVVFLVLTGIIAEPETVIEQIVRAIGG